MNLNSRIKFYCFAFILIFKGICIAQINDSMLEINGGKRLPKNQVLGTYAIGYTLPIATGDNFVGKGLEGKGGYSVDAQLFVFKHFFISGTFGVNYFDVKNKEIIGNYYKAKEGHQYLGLGYEFVLATNFRLGFSTALFGKSQFINTSETNNRVAFQRDTGRIRCYELYFDYMLNKIIALHLNAAYRNDRMDIKTASEIQPLFDNAGFYTVTFGLRLYFGNKDVFSGIKSAK
ncbi:hypothetical protein RBH94_06460 [Aestuariibaculum sp. YM273]|uniref:hypothetical protein n=1 Tax=Aestuariibaculum sp. YM273 TaxID=3070659 RepID=UPI0027DE9375|nr:hypothetical protein [Aestuariibaculum sp. YM273]WMI66803.1 hypothetical protein RBH94_06460 [Aestuariibaculum sp. YM273]